MLITILAETNRTPFDLPEAEAELVAGFNVEYSAIAFAMFFLGEYSNMFLMSALMSILFFGGWANGVLAFALKTCAVAFYIVIVRGELPRYRYDQLMLIGWRNFLLIILGFILLLAGLCFAFDAFPENPDKVWVDMAVLFDS